MNNALETVEIARRVLNLFFIIDRSGSMSGMKMGTVNTAIREVLPELKKISDENADAEIRIAIMAFSNEVEWIQMPTALDAIVWQDLVAEGCTNIGKACEEMNRRLSKSEFMTSASGSYAPVEILMSDGAPTDSYKKPLEALQQNKWHRHAVKAAIAIGEDADKKMLAEFTENPELVLTATTPEALRQIIRFVSVTSSKISSQSAGVGQTNVTGSNGQVLQQKQAAFAQQVQDFKDSNLDINALSDGF